MSKILVTGGAGFVGSHLCELLSKDSANKIYSLDNYFTGSESNHVEGVTYIRDSTTNIFNYEWIKPDIIYHLGEYSRVEQSFEDIQMVWEFNKRGTWEVINFAHQRGAKLVYSASSTKFADTDGYLVSPYAWSKSSNVELLNNFAQWKKLDYAITYFYNAYGRREISTGDYATLIAKFANKMKHNETLHVTSPGTQERNFTDVRDIVAGLALVGLKGSGDGYGIGSDKSYTIIEVAEMFGGNYAMLEPKAGNRMSAQLMTSKTKELGWTPKYRLQDWIDYLRDKEWNV